MKHVKVAVWVYGSLALAPALAWSSCVEPIPVMHFAMVPPDGGAFDLSATGYAKQASPGPDVRFWAYGDFAKANSGSQPQHNKGTEWLMHPALDYKLKEVPMGHWVGFQMNWFGSDIVGCVRDASSNRTVVELSFADPALEGDKGHQGYYAVVSVTGEPAGFDLGKVKNAQGGHVIAVLPIPVPMVEKVGAAKAGYRTAKVRIEAPVSFSEDGRDKPVSLVAGTKLYYATGAAPTTSKPDAYKPVLDPSNPKKELGVIAKDSGSVEIAVPEDAAWLVARVAYDDPKTEILSNAVSAHTALEASSAGRARGGERRR